MPPAQTHPVKKNLSPNDSALDAELLLAVTIKKTREWIVANPEYTPTRTQLSKFNELINRRARGEPVAYILGHKQFYGLDFDVTKDVLIPRPATELLVERVLAMAKSYFLTKPKPAIGFRSQLCIIDIGTGSGCIIISLAKYLQVVPKNQRPKLYAIDNSQKALRIARKNNKKHGPKNTIKFLRSNLLANLPNAIYQTQNIIFVANLPYLNQTQYQSNIALGFEPKSALIGGHYGLKYYRNLLKQLSKKILPNKHLTLLMEIDPSQKSTMYKLAKAILPNSEITFQKDLGSHTRICEIHYGMLE